MRSRQATRYSRSVPVQYVELLGALNSDETVGRFSSREQLSNDSDQSQLSYDVRQAGILECIAYGGNPAPHARIFVADEELVAETSNIRHSLAFSLMGTTRGLQWYNFTARHYSDDFRLAPSAEGKIMRCVGDVAEKSDPKQVSVVLTVLGRCPDNVAAYRTCSTNIRVHVSRLQFTHNRRCRWTEIQTYSPLASNLYGIYPFRLT